MNKLSYKISSIYQIINTAQGDKNTPKKWESSLIHETGSSYLLSRHNLTSLNISNKKPLHYHHKINIIYKRRKWIKNKKSLKNISSSGEESLTTFQRYVRMLILLPSSCCLKENWLVDRLKPLQRRLFLPTFNQFSLISHKNFNNLP